jgi:hypothetical protein
LDGVTEGCRDLILAIFRSSVADYLGQEYGHDDAGRPRAVRPRHRADAEMFLRGPWAACLGDWINLSSELVWREARSKRMELSRLSATASARVA